MSANEPGQPTPNRIADTVSVNLDTPRVALAVGAHPDDVEFGCGGTLAKWAAAGCMVHYLVLTDGSKGTWNPDADTAAIAEQRQDEQRAAAKRLSGENAGEVFFFGYVDGELRGDLAVVSRVAEVIRTVRPDVILGHDPWKQYRLHPDHRIAGQLVCDGVVAARDPHFFPEHNVGPHRPARMLLWEAEVVDHIEDVSGSIATKLSALEAHRSQFETTMHALDDDELAAFRRRITQRLAAIGKTHGYAAAEAFKLIADL